MYRFTGWVFILHIILIIRGLIIPHPLMGYFVSLVIVLSSLVYLKNGLFLLFAFFPLRPFLVEINEGLTYLGDALILFILGAVFINKRPWKNLFKNYSWLAAVGVFLLIGLISGLLSGISLTAGIFQIRALIITVLVLILAKEITWRKGDLQKIIWISLGTAVLLSLHGIVEKLTLRQWLLPEAWTEWNLASANAMRIYGLIGNPNVLATYLLIVFFLTFLLKKKTWWLIPVRLLIVGTTLLTFSRGTLLAFAGGTAIFLLIYRYWKKIIPLTLYGVAAFVLIYYPVVSATELIEENGYFHETAQSDQSESNSAAKKPVTVKENNVFIERFKEMFASETVQASAEWGRIYVVLKGVEIFLDHPLIGSGFATYGDAATQSFSSPIYEEYGILDGLYADNQYIALLTETGIIGTLIILTLFGWLIYKLWNIQHRLWRTISLSAVFVFMISGLFYNILEDKTFTLYFYFIIGYVLNKRNMETDYEMD
ncbi:O-antigen ligase [Halobacillus sp. Marseille-Q1614]|uniref:O-antigen ligase family protein n=1 Tax=Halobacillus sp. Marseille-Q1614 TaxID=2709134 RepID=UPI00156DF723|nr:O-antigen ligase family protein [Halobacillus sp. Marseille-Q1614]